MALKKEVRVQLISIFRSPSTLQRRKNKVKSSYGPMTSDEAGYVLAHLQGIDLSQYLSISELDKISSLVPRDILTYPLLTKQEVSEAYKLGKEVYPMMFVIENSIRNLIIRNLSVYGDDWWDTQIDPDVKRDVARIMRIEKKYPYRQSRGNHPLLYANFSDLKKIILYKKTEFKNEIFKFDWFEVHMDEIYMVRNNLAHCVPLSPIDISRLEVFHRDWANLMDTAGIH